MSDSYLRLNMSFVSNAQPYVRRHDIQSNDTWQNDAEPYITQVNENMRNKHAAEWPRIMMLSMMSHSIMALRITTFDIVTFRSLIFSTATISTIRISTTALRTGKSPHYNDVLHNDTQYYSKIKSCWQSQIGSLCWVLFCWVFSLMMLKDGQHIVNLHEMTQYKDAEYNELICDC